MAAIFKIVGQFFKWRRGVFKNAAVRFALAVFGWGPSLGL
jgi:hypothetical protein